ncbi:MAG TPA: hypothetical protein VN812_10600 [Candidatus Acidoferrales bacterium]|nr:hypothetical protein [Candidatus Acidoferrales bacterium]
MAQWLPRYYLDTSVIGGAVDAEEPQRLRLLDALFVCQDHRQVQLHSSVVLLEEIARAPQPVRTILEPYVVRLRLPILAESEASRHAAETLVRTGVLSRDALDDARHLGCAMVAEMDAVVSWNFKHLVNPARRRGIQSVCALLGLRVLDVISPLEVVDDEPS